MFFILFYHFLDKMVVFNLALALYAHFKITKKQTFLGLQAKENIK